MKMFYLLSMLLAPNVFFAPDDGGAGGATTPAAAEGTLVATDPKQPEATPAAAEGESELEKTKKELKALQDEKAAQAKVAKEAERAKMSDDEKKAAELKDLQDSLVKQNRTLQLSKAGLEEKYLPLVAGATAEEVEQNGKLLAQLVEEVKANAIATAKKGIAQTGAPGQDHVTGKVDSKTFFKTILGVK
ncbi:hypothetical protein [uncultured Sphaerochaeta sp.]|uniref:hypothetical protein n=1 Tax=uncultured Sphaerochaeta sp. TaxID=886478 RepID=UPI002A0A5930|nr:hypothetical protein [uncultured Sphaerochaeta sp.]